jgi:5,10-methylenetetrahydrofolate reductase
VMTQPVFDLDLARHTVAKLKPLGVPVFLGVMPLLSSRNAELLHNEVPGIKIADKIRERIRRYEGEAARAEGVEIAKELLDEAVQLFKGIYLMTPFHYYEMTAELTKYVHEVTRVDRAVH